MWSCHIPSNKKDSAMARVRKNPASYVSQRPKHVNTYQQANDNNAIFGAFFKHLNGMKDLPHNFSLWTLTTNPHGIADGAFITFTTDDSFEDNDYFDFMRWLANEALSFELYVYNIQSLPLYSGYLVVRVYMK